MMFIFVLHFLGGRWGHVKAIPFKAPKRPIYFLKHFFCPVYSECDLLQCSDDNVTLCLLDKHFKIIYFGISVRALFMRYSNQNHGG